MWKESLALQVSVEEMRVEELQRRKGTGGGMYE